MAEQVAAPSTSVFDPSGTTTRTTTTSPTPAIPDAPEETSTDTTGTTSSENPAGITQYNTLPGSLLATQTTPEILPQHTLVSVTHTSHHTTFTTTTQGFFTLTSYQSSLVYYTTSGTRTSIVFTSTITPVTLLKVPASDLGDAEASFESIIHSLEQAKPTLVPLTSNVVVPDSSKLTTGSKAGIGVGVGIGALMIFGSLAFWILRRRKHSMKERDRPYINAKAELEGDQRKQRGQEKTKELGEAEGQGLSEAPEKVEEVGDTAVKRYELEGNFRGNELT